MKCFEEGNYYIVRFGTEELSGRVLFQVLTFLRGNYTEYKDYVLAINNHGFFIHFEDPRKALKFKRYFTNEHNN